MINTQVNSKVGFWLRWHPCLFIRLHRAYWSIGPASTPASGLMKIQGANFAKFPTFEFTWV
ncbi:MAG: hypothetical protein WA678_06680 [Rhabdochlamydiaceae bacterium]|jgi:hypothetical protein